jgi:hypothetical protein
VSVFRTWVRPGGGDVERAQDPRRPVGGLLLPGPVAEGREHYYAGEGEESGRWVGSGASLLEWTGEVDADDFTSLLGGAGQRKPRVDGVAGFDLTFRAPKSVSVLWAIAPERVLRELRDSVRGRHAGHL